MSPAENRTRICLVYDCLDALRRALCMALPSSREGYGVIVVEVDRSLETVLASYSEIGRVGPG